jgi:tetratricopeptide (TPR) repeat protein
MVRTLKDLFSRKVGSGLPDAEAWFQRGNAHVPQRQWQHALDCYREAVRIDPNHAGAHAYMGNVLRQLREPDAAVAAYDRAIAVKPDYAEAHYNRGAVLHQARQSIAALQSYDAALSINSSFAEAHCSRGDVLRELGRLDEALAGYNAAISINGSYAKAYLHRGTLEQELRQPEVAEASYRQAIALSPNYADAHFNLGALQRETGGTAAALASFDTAIAIEPGHVGAHAERGAVLMAMGQNDLAVASFDIAIRLKPDFARVFSNRAQAQANLGLLAAARASHDQAVFLDPQDAAIHFNRGAFLSDCKDSKEAIESYRAAIALKPDHADAYSNMGLVQQEAGQADAAMDSYARALAINPRLATALNNRGNLFRSRRQFADALRDYRQALALEPDSADVHYNIGQLALLQGDFTTGWPEYEWRRLIKEALTVPARRLPQPAWFGDHSLRGRRIFLHAEQGLGDTIQFCRYVSLVAELGAHVTLEVQPPLGELLANLEGVSQLVLYGEPIPAADYQCSVMSLPGAFKTTMETIPCQIPYLRADPYKVARWHEILGPRTRPRIGLTWSGNPHHSNDRNRSIPLARWITNLPDGFEYICLQNEIREADLQVLRSSPKIKTIQSSFADAAALIETLDLVVSVDTSIAHLSGALGKKTWILLPFLPDWRWLVDRRESPWYPTATLYRQPVAGDWDSVLAEVKNDLLMSSTSFEHQALTGG